MTILSDFKLFDAHLHIIDPAFPLVANQGYVPLPFTVDAYQKQLADYQLGGGAVVSGSFQGYDQSYLIAALAKLGAGFVGVAQLPFDYPDAKLDHLHQCGVRALRFNFKRGSSIDLSQLKSMAMRVYERYRWHVELYIDSAELADLSADLLTLPALSIDHLGLSDAGFNTLLNWVDKGVRVKATGFGRINFAADKAMQKICAVNPEALLFGTDLPSTRAPRPYQTADFIQVIEALGEKQARRVFYANAAAWYRLNDT